MTFAFGQPIPLSVNLTDINGVPGNATAITLTIILPDGSTTFPTITNPVTGSYTATYVPTQAGLHHVRWVATGSNASAFSDVFSVDAATPPMLVSLADVKDYLSITSTVTAHDGRLQRYIEGATSMLVDVIGPISPTTFVETHDGGRPFIMLRNPPIISVTSITEYIGLQGFVLTDQPLGATTSMWGYSLSPQSGKVTRRGSVGDPIPFQGGRMSVSVTYVAGQSVIDPAVTLAALEDIRGLYSQTQFSATTVVVGDLPQDNAWTPVGTFPRLQAILQGLERVQALA